jgi:PE family
MSYVIAAPEIMTAAAADLETLGSTLSAAHQAAAPSTLAVIPAAADEVSASIAHLFSQHAADYQALAGQAAAFQHQFVHNLKASAASYASAEAANTALLQPLAATADSIGSALGAFWDQLVNMFNAAVGQLGNLWTTFWNQFLTIVLGAISIAGILLIGLPFLSILVLGAFAAIVIRIFDPSFFAPS